MANLSGLSPKPVWNFFEQVCAIPRPSGHEKKIVQFLIDFASKHNLTYKNDTVGNLLITKKANKGYEDLSTIVFQSHVDIVGEKEADFDFDFIKDPIIPVIEGDWIKANNTTLGADNGIGIAYQMALLVFNEFPHGKIECLFTVEEETGLTGVKNLQPKFFDGKIFINLDSEDENEIFIGCAGGLDTIITIKYDSVSPKSNHLTYEIGIKGLKGGHSGDDIHKGYGNSIHIINRFIWENFNALEIGLCEINGGNLRNAIPRDATATITIPKEKNSLFLSSFSNFISKINIEYYLVEPNIELFYKLTDTPNSLLSKESQFDIVNAIYACPHGVHTWSKSIKDFVESSTNLASIHTDKNKNEIIITTSQRSSLASLKYDIGAKVKSVFSLVGANINQNNEYPGWNPNPNSKLVKYASDIYTNMFNIHPVSKAIHAGLECGLIKEKYPDIDMISIGPTIRGAHTPEEKIQISSAVKYWNYLLEIVKNINEY